MRAERIPRIWPSIVTAGWSDALKGARKFEVFGQQDDPKIPSIDAAVDFINLIGVAAVEARIRALATRAKLQLKNLPAVELKTNLEPELSGGSLVAQNTALANPEGAKGKAIFEREGCNACHGDNGIGTAAGPKLVGIGTTYDEAKFEALLRHPTEKMTQGGMPPVELKADEMKPLIFYLQSLK